MQSSNLNHTGVWSFNPCGYSFLGEGSRFEFKGLQDLSDLNFNNKILDTVPIVLDWAIGTLSCVEAEKSNDYACLNNSRCVDSSTGLGGYRCACNAGYEGNPYIGPGCQGKLDFFTFFTCLNFHFISSLFSPFHLLITNDRVKILTRLDIGRSTTVHS